MGNTIDGNKVLDEFRAEQNKLPKNYGSITDNNITVRAYGAPIEGAEMIDTNTTDTNTTSAIEETIAMYNEWAYLNNNDFIHPEDIEDKDEKYLSALKDTMNMRMWKYKGDVKPEDVKWTDNQIAIMTGEMSQPYDNWSEATKFELSRQMGGSGFEEKYVYKGGN